MKFLCPSCKAKYQIADEKVAGRTLRMNCRQCKEEIVIRGDASTTGGSAVSMQPTATGPLGVDFQRQVAAGPAASVPEASAFDEWHVAINDIPVGPMGRQEVARKIAMGAVGPDSLAWREGLDDWLPIRSIAELAMLCSPQSSPPSHASALPAPPPPAAPPAPAMPPPPAMAPPPAAAQPPHASMAAPGGPGASSISQASMPAVSAAPFDPAARADMAPLGGRMGGGATEYRERPSNRPEPSAAHQSHHYSSEMDPIVRAPGQNMSWAPLFLMVCGGAFILAMGAVLGVKLQPTDRAQSAPVAPPEAPQQQAVAPTQPEPGPAEDEEFQANSIELDLQEIDGETRTAGGTRKTKSSSKTSSSSQPSSNGKGLTKAEKDLLARMGGGGVTLKKRSTGSSSTAGRSELTAAQLSKVVSKGKRTLQRCYEVALRGSGSEEAVRMDVDVTVSASGNVSRVATHGKGLPGMEKCITRTVRAWRFPASSGPTVTKFPIVFQPGA